MLMGREIALPLHALTEQPDGGKEQLTDYVQNLRQKMREAHERARSHMKMNLQRQKRNYDRHISGGKIQPGMFVWMHNTARKKGLSPKLQFKWIGPYLVLKKLSDVTFRIQEKPRSKPKVVHYDRLKIYTGPERKKWHI